MADSEDNNLSPLMVVLSIVNGMIGGLILILPVMAIDSGYLLGMIIIATTGFFSYFSCRLCITHIDNQPDLDTAILHHFNNNTKTKAFYDICVWSSLVLISFLYFELITLQWKGLLGDDTNLILNSIINAAVLFGIVFLMKYYEFGATLMAYGIISIVAYLLFLVWAVIDEDKSGDPQRPFEAFGSNAGDLAAAMGGAFSVQMFFIPVLKSNNNPKNYGKYVLWSYILGTISYFFIAFVGSYSILYRPFLESADSQKTIEGYFGYGNWQVKIIEVIYLVHLYSVFPQYVLIGKKRLFGVLNLPSTPARHINVQEIIYVCIIIATCFFIRVLRVPLSDIIDFNGAVVGFFFIYFIPAALHVKCMYFSKDKVPVQQQQQESDVGKYQEMIEEGDKDINIDGRNSDGDRNSENTPKADIEMKVVRGGHDSGGGSSAEMEAAEGDDSCLSTRGKFECNCDKNTYTTKGKILNGVLMGIMVSIGVFILINGVIQLGQEAAGKKKSS